MNGIHDCGGRHGYGPIDIDPEQPIFHADWERRMFGMSSLLSGAAILTSISSAPRSSK